MASQISVFIKVDPIIRDYYTCIYKGNTIVPLRFEYLSNLIRDKSQTKKRCGEVFIPKKEEEKEHLKVLLPYASDRNIFSYCRLSEKAMRDINSYLRSYFNEQFLNYVAGFLTAQSRILSSGYCEKLISETDSIVGGLNKSQATQLQHRVNQLIKPQLQQEAIEAFMVQYEIYYSDKNYQSLKKLWDRSFVKTLILKEKIIPNFPQPGKRNRREKAFEFKNKQPTLFQ